ncbi:MAG: AgmX/PglI C-terminal domain-containing protein [Myxococcales bacterium]
MRFVRLGLAVLCAVVALALVAFAFNGPPPAVAVHVTVPPTLPAPQLLPPAPNPVAEPPPPAEPVAEPVAAPEPTPAEPPPAPKPVPLTAPPKPLAVAKLPSAQPEPKPEAKAELLPSTPAMQPPPPDAEQTVRNTLRLSMTAFEACYSNSLRRDSRIKGRVVVTVHAEASGKVIAARVEETTLKDEGVVSCITSRLRAMRFPPLGEDVELTVPLSLVPHE